MKCNCTRGKRTRLIDHLQIHLTFYWFTHSSCTHYSMESLPCSHTNTHLSWPYCTRIPKSCQKSSYNMEQLYCTCRQDNISTTQIQNQSSWKMRSKKIHRWLFPNDTWACEWKWSIVHFLVVASTIELRCLKWWNWLKFINEVHESLRNCRPQMNWMMLSNYQMKVGLSLR
jgi:hypothetical protein